MLIPYMPDQNYFNWIYQHVWTRLWQPQSKKIPATLVHPTWCHEICICIWVTAKRADRQLISWGWIGETTREHIYADISAIPNASALREGEQPGLANEKIEKWGVRRWILRQAWDVGVKQGEKKHEALPPDLNGVHHFTPLRLTARENRTDFLKSCFY